MHHQDQRRDPASAGRPSACVSPEQQAKNGTKKWKTISATRHAPPAARDPPEVPGDLLGEVARPDDQELRERHVGPEHRERQHQVAEVVERAGRGDLGASGSDRARAATTTIMNAKRRRAPGRR